MLIYDNILIHAMILQCGIHDIEWNRIRYTT